MPSEARHHRPVLLDSERLDRYPQAQDLEKLEEAAQASAAALVSRGRASKDPSVIKRLVRYTDEFGLEVMAQLWSKASPVSLAGALWRIYALRALIRSQAQQVTIYFRLGLGSSDLDQALAGVPDPPGPQEICETVDQILAGAYLGDFDVALDRFAAFCRVLALGQQQAQAAPGAKPQKQTRLLGTAQHLEEAALAWRAGQLL